VWKSLQHHGLSKFANILVTDLGLKFGPEKSLLVKQKEGVTDFERLTNSSAIVIISLGVASSTFYQQS
jgi:hypothetical protein